MRESGREHRYEGGDAGMLTYLLDEVTQSLLAGVQLVTLLDRLRTRLGQAQTLRQGTFRGAALQRNGIPQVGVYLHVSPGS